MLSSSGQAQDVKTDVQTMAGVSLPPSEKYLQIGAEAMLRENAVGRNRLEVSAMLVPVRACCLELNHSIVFKI